MSIFKKRSPVLPLPEGFTAADIRVESSVCTGEKTIGFYNAAEKKQLCADQVRTDGDKNTNKQNNGLTSKH